MVPVHFPQSLLVIGSVSLLFVITIQDKDKGTWYSWHKDSELVCFCLFSCTPTLVTIFWAKVHNFVVGWVTRYPRILFTVTFSFLKVHSQWFCPNVFGLYRWFGDVHKITWLLLEAQVFPLLACWSSQICRRWNSAFCTHFLKTDSEFSRHHDHQPKSQQHREHQGTATPC